MKGKGYQAGTAFIRVTPDMRDFKSLLERQVKDNLAGLGKADVDTKQAKKQLRELGKAYDEAGTPRVNKKALAKADKMLDGLTKRHSKSLVEVEVDSIRARKELAKLGQGQKLDLSANIKLDKNSLTREFDKARKEIAKRPLFGPDAEKSAARVYKRALKLDRIRGQMNKQSDAAYSALGRMDDIDGRVGALKKRQSELASSNGKTAKSYKDLQKANDDYVKAGQSAIALQKEMEAAERRSIAAARDRADAEDLKTISLAEQEKRAKAARQANTELNRSETALNTARRKRDEQRNKVTEIAAKPGSRRVTQAGTGEVDRDLANMKKIADAYRKLQKEHGGKKGQTFWGGTSELREATSDVSREDFDRAMQKMQRRTGATVSPEENKKTLTAKDRADAVNIGGQPNHLFSADDDSLRKLDAEVDANRKLAASTGEVVTESRNLTSARDKLARLDRDAADAELRHLNATDRQAAASERDKAATAELSAARDLLRDSSRKATDAENEYLAAIRRSEAAEDKVAEKSAAADIARRDQDRLARQNRKDNKEEMATADAAVVNYEAERKKAQADLDAANGQLKAMKGESDRTRKDLNQSLADYRNIKLNTAREAQATSAISRRRLTVEKGDDDSAMTRLTRNQDATRMGTSKNQRDVDAYKRAKSAALDYDRAEQHLAQTLDRSAASERALAAATLHANDLRERGAAGTTAGIKAIDRQNAAQHDYNKNATKVTSAEEIVEDRRHRYNTSIRGDRRTGTVGLQDRIDTNPIRRMGEALSSVAGSALQKFNTKLLFASRLLSAVGSLGVAAAAGVGVLGVINMVPVIGALAGVANAIAILPALAAGAAAAIGAIAIGVSGVSNAFKAGTKLSDAIASPDPSGDKAGINAAKQQRNSARQIAQAEKGVQRAQKDSVSSQKDLTKAREEARQTIDDLNFSLGGLSLDEDDAALSVREARESLAQTLGDSEATGTEKNRARLSVKQALRRQTEVQRANAKTRNEARDANVKGVEGSDQVTAAQDRVAQSAEAVADAVESLNDARSDAADQSAATAAGMTAEQKAAAEYEAELRKLAPAAQGFIVGMRSMSDAWKKLRNSVQQQLFRNLGVEIAEVAEGQLPVFQKGLSDVAGEINGGLRHALTYLRTDASRVDFAKIFDKSATASGNFTRGLSNVLQAFVPLAAVGSDFLPSITRGFEDNTREFAKFINKSRETGELQTFLANASISAKKLGTALFQTGRIIGAVFAGSSDQGKRQLDDYIESATKLGDRLNSIAGQEGIKQFFLEVQKELGTLLELLGKAGDVFTQTIFPAFRDAKAIITPIVQVLASVGQGLLEMGGLAKTALTIWLAFKAYTLIFGGLSRAVVGTARGIGLLAPASVRAVTGLTAVQRASQQARISNGLMVRSFQGTTPALNAMSNAARAVRLTELRNGLNNTTTAASRMAGAGRRVGAGGMAGAAAAMGGLARAGGGLASALGGPVGIAIAGAIIGFSAYSSAAAKAKTATEELNKANEAYKASAEGVRSALRTSRGAIDTGTTEQLAKGVGGLQTEIEGKVASKKSMLEGFVDGGEVMKGITFGLGGPDKTAYQKSQEEAASAKATQKAMKDVGVTYDDLTTKLGGGQAEFDTLIDNLRGTSKEGGFLADRLVGMRRNLEDAQRVILSAPKGYLDLADATATLADETASASDKADAFRRKIEALIPGHEQQQAMFDLTKTIDEITDRLGQLDQTKGLGEDLFKGDALDATKGNASELNDTLLDLASKTAAAQFAGEDMNVVWEQTNQALGKVQGSFQLTDDRIASLRKQYGLTQTALSKALQINGATEATQQVSNLNDVLAQFNGKPVSAVVEVKDEQAKKALRDTGVLVEDVAGQPGWVTITANSEDARTKVAELQAQLVAVSLLRVNTVINADTGKLELKAGLSKTVLDQLGAYRNDPVIGAVIDDLLTNGNTAITKLQEVTRNAPNPQARLILDQLLKDRDKANEILGGINIGGLVVSLVTNPEGTKAKPQAQTGAAGVDLGILSGNPKKPDGKYNGGRLRGYALGGRMPATGPGTQSRDGIYAVRPDGQAVARVNGTEWVINPDMSAKFDHALGLINNDDPSIQTLAGYAAGGRMGTPPAAAPAPGLGPMPQLKLGAVGDPFAPLTGGIAQFGGELTKVVDGQAIPGWARFGDQLKAVTDTSIAPNLGGVSAQLDGLGAKVPEVVNNSIIPSWTAGAQAIVDAKTGSIDPAFAGIQGGLNTVSGAFGTGVAAIKTQWDGIRSATADPVRFTIDSVFNNGLVGMWNSVSDLIGAKKMTPYAAKFATGGVLPGYTPGVDVHKFVSPTGGQLHLSGGEAIMRPEWTRAVGGANAVNQMNRAAVSGTLAKNGKGEGRYAAGGVTDLAYGVAPGSQINSGGAGFPGWVYQLGGSHGVQPSTYAGHQESNRAEAGYAPNPQGLNRGIDWSGPVPAMQKFAEYLLGIAPRTPSLEQIIWMNPETGQKIGWHGRSPDVGGGYFASDYPGHTDHVHTRQNGPIAPGVGGAAFAGMLGAAALGSTMDMGALVRGLIEPKAEEVRKKVAGTKFPGMIGGLPGQVLNTGIQAITSTATKLAGASIGPGAPAPGIGAGDQVERWRPMVIAALRRNGFEPNQRNQDLMLGQIKSESSGNPKAVQQVVDVNTGGNEAVGILQIAKGTWPGVRDPSLPDDRTDPWASMNGALRYYRGKYGDDLGTQWGQGHGYDNGGIFKNNTFGVNTSGKPEAVFTNPQWKQVDKLVDALTDPQMFATLTGEVPVAAGTPAPAGTVNVPAKVVNPPKNALPAVPGATDPAVVTPPAGEPLPQSQPIPNNDTDLLGGVKSTEPQQDWVDTYTGPLSDVFKKGKLLGQIGQAGAKPGALAKLADPDREWRDAVAKSRIDQERTQGFAAKTTELQPQIDKLRADGKTAEADKMAADLAALDPKSADSKLAANDPRAIEQARLATLADGPSPMQAFMKTTNESFQKYLGENAMGIAESVISGGMSTVGNSGAGNIIINGGMHTSDDRAAWNQMERQQKRKARANQRAGGR